MRLLIFGAAGMLGHKALQTLAGRFEVAGTVRRPLADYAGLSSLSDARLFPGVSADDPGSVEGALDSFRPDAVLNCIGVVKQLKQAHNPVVSIGINALFPHQIATQCRARGIRMVQFSTDCVFSGHTGNYNEDDPPDAEDLYGRTKLLGEIVGPGCLTLRTSIVGRELDRHTGLFDWFLSNRGGRVKGYRRALYTGYTTLALSRLIGDILEHHPGLEGLWHVASDAINKYDLLVMLNEAVGSGITIEPDDAFICDRRLDSTRFRRATDHSPPSWPEMIEELAADPTPYPMPELAGA